jgi:hypothetical protein
MNRVALTLLLALIAVPVFAKLSSKEVKSLKRNMSKARKAEDWDDLASLMRRLAEAKNKKTWKFLLKMAESAPKASEVHRALGDATATMSEAKGVDKEARKALKKSKVAGVRRAMLHYYADKKDWPAVIGAVGDKNEEVEYAAIWTLARNKVEAGVDPLIKRMAALDKSQDGNWIELRSALTSLLGQKHPAALDYRSLWDALKAQGGLKAAQPFKPTTGGGGGTVTASLFGEAIESSRVVFIVDTSGSMTTKDRPPRGSAGTGGKRVPLKTRLDRAKEQLQNVIKGLHAKMRINIVNYSSSTNIKIWKDGEKGAAPDTHPLTKANRESAAKFVAAFQPIGSTSTDLAMIKAYTIKNVRAFYLLSDGAPTMPGGAAVLDPKVIYKVVRDHDRGRGITINTMGFKGARKDIMQKLASLTGGRYTTIR